MFFLKGSQLWLTMLILNYNGKRFTTQSFALNGTMETRQNLLLELLKLFKKTGFHPITKDQLLVRRSRINLQQSFLKKSTLSPFEYINFRNTDCFLSFFATLRLARHVSDEQYTMNGKSAEF